MANFGHFQNALIFRVLGVFFEWFFAHNISNVPLQSFFAPFWHFEFLTQTGHFVKAIALASWPILAIFKMLSFFEY